MTRRVIVVGGGAAGLMAAGQAAAAGAETLLLEKMDQPGRKILITGSGRCNLTNLAPLPDFITHFGPNGRFLRPAFGQFFADDLLAFFRAQGVRTITEASGRVFPASENAQDVVDALVRWALNRGVRLQTGARVERLRVEGGRVTGVEVAGSPPICRVDAVIVTTGGASYPGTGSTGDGYRLAESVGHTVVSIRPALIPLKTAGDTTRRLMGVSLRDVRASVWINGRRQAGHTGEMLFTHFGVSGPLILALSKTAVDGLRAGQRVSLSIDLLPDLDEPALDTRLLRDLDAHGKQQVHTLLKEWLPRKLIPVALDLTGIPPDRSAHQITAHERRRLRAWLKDFRLDITGYQPLAAAIVTAGGVDLREVEPRTLESRLVKGLYFAGEVLDLDADTGGYNLQAAFSTGWLAGHSAAQ
ncbi:MAG: NAD(P)/FAD-dependent oxidoreductase [Chloroflexi bacterium]|nr:NAD(P)/FAD-dependent oxidoreductase [Chloroflexota bacterium]